MLETTSIEKKVPTRRGHPIYETTASTAAAAAASGRTALGMGSSYGFFMHLLETKACDSGNDVIAGQSYNRSLFAWCESIKFKNEVLRSLHIGTSGRHPALQKLLERSACLRLCQHRPSLPSEDAAFAAFGFGRLEGLN